MSDLSYKRVLLKVSGEALMGEGAYGIDNSTVNRIAIDVRKASEMGAEICLVIGGGNIFRGLAGVAQWHGARRPPTTMGMLATVMNALAVSQAHLSRTRASKHATFSAIPMPTVCEPLTARQRAKRHLEKGRVVIFAAGTGNPFFTTDTAAALRAAEMQL